MNISVVIPLYNKAPFVDAALISVLSQTFSPCEVIVVDDGSSDGGGDIARANRNPLIKVVSQQNAGVSVARNRGVEMAKGEWIAFLDADDYWYPNHLQLLSAAAERNPTSCLVGSAYCEMRGGIKTRSVRTRLPVSGVLHDYFRASAYVPIFFTSSLMAKRSSLIAVGAFPIGVTHGEDLDTWARLALVADPVYVAEETVAYNLGIPGQATALKKLPSPPIVKTLREAHLHGEKRRGELFYLGVNLPQYWLQNRLSTDEYLSLIYELKISPLGVPWFLWRSINRLGMMKWLIIYGLKTRGVILKRKVIAHTLLARKQCALRYAC